jgi:predicted acylesterase/phospholipase RssA
VSRRTALAPLAIVACTGYGNASARSTPRLRGRRMRSRRLSESPITAGSSFATQHPGSFFEGWIREHFESKGITRFGQLHDPIAEGADPSEPQYRLQVIASDLTKERMLVLPRDAREQLGIDPDELEIAKAVRMSMSIPMFFDPVVHQNPTKRDDEHVIVDGGLLSNFPIWLFDCPPDQVPRWPTFGMLLVAPNQRDPLIAGPSPGTPGPARSSTS